jgi:hypothetical protein
VATIASLLRDHVTLRVRSVDRLFLQGYVPRLMTERMVVRFLLDRGYPIPSPALLGRIGAGMCRRSSGSPLSGRSRSFSQGRVEGADGAGVFRARRGGGPKRRRVDRHGAGEGLGWRGWRDGHPHFCFRRQTVFVKPRGGRAACLRRGADGARST